MKKKHFQLFKQPLKRDTAMSKKESYKIQKELNLTTAKNFKEWCAMQEAEAIVQANVEEAVVQANVEEAVVQANVEAEVVEPIIQANAEAEVVEPIIQANVEEAVVQANVEVEVVEPIIQANVETDAETVQRLLGAVQVATEVLVEVKKVSKASLAKVIFEEEMAKAAETGVWKKRKLILARLVKEAGLTLAGASTYLVNLRKSHGLVSA
jgi:hypothetical protein